LYVDQDSNGRISNATGVHVRPIDFGGVNGVEYSDYGTYDLIKMPYMKDLIESLESIGYERGKSLRAATYDFRPAGISEVLAYQYQRLKELIEDTYKTNGKTSVHLLSHSLGGPYTTVFLNTAVSAEWKKTYVASHIMLSAPLLGTPVATEGLMTGPSYDFVPQFLPRLAVPAIRTWPSMIWMIPHTDSWGNRSFVTTPETTYGVADSRRFVKDIDSPVLAAAFDDVATVIKTTPNSPGVPVFCAYANDTKTTLSVSLSTDVSNAKSVDVTATSMGDGTVPLLSLKHCTNWPDTKLAREYSFGGSLAAHTEIVRLPALLSDINEWVSGAFEMTNF